MTNNFNRFKRAFILSLSLASAPLFAGQVHHYQLKNGMQVYIKPDARAPVVVHQVWYKVGSNYEQNGTTGIAHMLEHMMFKGTKHYQPGAFSKKVSQLGGQENAFTSTDYTAYYQVIGKQHLQKVMEMEADRMRNLVISDAEFYKERDVVTEERRWRVEDRPTSQLYEQFIATAFVNSPLHHPTIGWMNDIQNYTADDARNWYRTWYAPNNASLIVVGDVDPEQVYEWAQDYYGQYQAEKIQRPKPQQEIEQQGERRIRLEGAVKSPSLLMGFHTPTLVTAKTETERQEVYALAVLSSILDGDDSSRLTKNLIRGSKIVASAGASYDETDRLTTLFLLSATPSADKTLVEAEAALWQQIKLLQTELISEAELERVLAHAEAQYVFHQDSTQAQAMILGALVSVGLPADTLETWVDNLRKVTPEQVKAVAQKYLQSNRATVGELVPNGKTPTKTVAYGRHAGGIR